MVLLELQSFIVQRRGIFTLPVEDARLRCACPGPCEGIEVRKIGLERRDMELLARSMEDRFVERMAVRGYELLGGLRLHGPWPSYDFNNHLLDVESSIFSDAKKTHGDGEEHPELSLGAVFEREGAFNPYMDYLLVGDFTKKGVWTEIIVPEGG